MSYDSVSFSVFSKNLVQNGLSNATMKMEDVLELYTQMEKEKLYEHYTFPDNPSSDGYYHLNVKAMHTKEGKRKNIKARSLDELREKLWNTVYADTPAIKRNTFREVFELWQAAIIKDTVNAEKLVSVKNTVSRNRSEYKRFFSETILDNAFIDELTVPQVDLTIRRAIEKYQLRQKGIASIRTLVNGIFRYAFTEYMVSENLAERIDFRRYNSLAAAPVPIAERVHCENDVNRLMDYLHDYQQTHPRYLPSYALELQIIMGLRRGEIPPLTRDDVTNDYVYIHRELLTAKKTDDTPEHFVIVNHTKTDRDRYYPMTSALQEFFSRLYDVLDRFYPSSSFLFPANNENGCITNNTVYNFYRRTLSNLNIQTKDGIIIGTHSFRRNAITKAVNASGGNIELVSRIYGNSPEVIRKNYFTGIDLVNAREILEHTIS
jgi:integrase